MSPTAAFKPHTSGPPSAFQHSAGTPFSFLTQSQPSYGVLVAVILVAAAAIAAAATAASSCLLLATPSPRLMHTALTNATWAQTLAAMSPLVC